MCWKCLILFIAIVFTKRLYGGATTNGAIRLCRDFATIVLQVVDLDELCARELVSSPLF